MPRLEFPCVRTTFLNHMSHFDMYFSDTKLLSWFMCRAKIGEPPFATCPGVRGGWFSFWFRYAPVQLVSSAMILHDLFVGQGHLWGPWPPPNLLPPPPRPPPSGTSPALHPAFVQDPESCPTASSPCHARLRT